MKLTLNWLKEFVSFKNRPEQIAEMLTMAGFEVESLTPLRTEKGEAEDWLMEVAVTPNRGDCLGILGLAREVAALTGAPVKLPPAARHAADGSIRRLVDVKISSPRLCPRYSARIVRDIHVGPSPTWMRDRLEACGIRSINNVVDITNYVMLETGQPLHAFDFDRLKSKRIVVRQAGNIRKFKTLDGVERELAQGDLLICDGDMPVAIAGVMGGMESEVQISSKVVLLESAHFDPISVRRTAKRLGLHTEASHRFERGVDPEGTLYALDRAVLLLAQFAKGIPVQGTIDRYPGRVKATAVFLRDSKVQRLLGMEMKRSEVEKIIKSLGLKVQQRSKSGLKVIAPSYRPDLSREADLIEELARLYGYEKIPSTLPLARPQGSRADSHLSKERKVRSFLIGEGVTELINLPFASNAMNLRFPGLWQGRASPVPILNPLVQENSEMRLSLIPGLIQNLQTHMAQRLKSFWGFELGKVFCSHNGNDFPKERQQLAILLHGQRQRKGLKAKEEEPLDFADAKGLLEGIMDILGRGDQAIWSHDTLPSFLHPGKAAWLKWEDSGLGYLGEFHPDLCEGLDLPRFFIMELDFEKLLQYAPPKLTARSLPRFPSVERDLAVVVDEGFPAQRIINWIKDQGDPLIEDVQVFDQYRGSPIPEGKKSLAYRVCYRAEERTLTDAEVGARHQDLILQIGQAFGAQLRT
jgi:phenylalanyl-tRNA synthetase beta chain